MEADWYSAGESLGIARERERNRVLALQRDLETLTADVDAEIGDPGGLRVDDRLAARASTALRDLVYDEPYDITHSIDFSLETRHRVRLVSDTRNQRLFLFLMRIAGEAAALDRDNHGFGYHFHYVRTNRRKPERTNVLLTFSPHEPKGPPDCLFWETHGDYANADPSQWGNKRQVAVHSAAAGSLRTLPKTTFKMPGKSATQLACR